MLNEKNKFILKYTLRAIIYLAILIVVAIIFKKTVIDLNPEFWIEKFYSKPLIIYLIYIGSEVFFGLFPPELFMYWSMNLGGTGVYILNVAFFTLVSLFAGHLAYFIGRLLYKRFSEKLYKRKFFIKYIPWVQKFGPALIIIAAMTPLPWSTICLIMGAIRFDYGKFTLYSTSRIIRFILYAYLVFGSKTLFF